MYHITRFRRSTTRIFQESQRKLRLVKTQWDIGLPSG